MMTSRSLGSIGSRDGGGAGDGSVSVDGKGGADSWFEGLGNMRGKEREKERGKPDGNENIDADAIVARAAIAEARLKGVIEGWGWLPTRTTEEDEESDRRADGEEEEAVFKAEPEVYDTF